LVAFFSVTLRDQGFLSPDNLLNIGRVTATISIMAVATVFVLSTGEIDLSIGGVVALSAVTAALVMQTQAAPIGVLAGLGVGLLVGLLNGLLTTKLRVPSFLITLGMLQVASGLARTISNLQAIPIASTDFQAVFGAGKVLGIETIYLWTLVVLVVGHVVYRKTPFGRHVLATGGNRLAAVYSGVSTNRVKIAALAISGLGAALAGLLDAGRLGGARYDFGSSDLLTVLAAVVIGGTSMFGGRGSVVGALIGSLLLGTLTDGLILMNISVSNQMIAQGAIIILAVAVSLRDPADAEQTRSWRERLRQIRTGRLGRDLGSRHP
jgi:ribose transport system permease protein